MMCIKTSEDLVSLTRSFGSRSVGVYDGSKNHMVNYGFGNCKCLSCALVLNSNYFRPDSTVYLNLAKMKSLYDG